MNAVGFVTGLAAEARVAARLGPAEAGGGTPGGAAAAAERLVAAGARALVSFGLAGGLDPKLRAGALLVPLSVVAADGRWPTDPALSALLCRERSPGDNLPLPPTGGEGWGEGGGPGAPRLVAAETIIATAEDKAALFARTGAAAVDLESAAVARVAARHGLPFAVLRAVCDPAGFALPPAALVPLTADGRVDGRAVAAALLRRPGQVPALVALARHAAVARAALVRRVGDLVAVGGLGVP